MLRFTLVLTQAAFVAAAAIPTAVDCSRSLYSLLQDAGSFRRSMAVGFHGTSIEALAYARRTGKMAPGIQPENAGGLYFYPNLAHEKMRALVRAKAVTLGENTVPGEDADPMLDAWNGAVGYADDIAKHHRFMRLLSLDFSPEVSTASNRYLRDPSDIDHADALVKLGADRKKLRAAFDEAQKARGVVLLLGTEILDKMRISNAAPGDDGLRIDTGTAGGVPLDLFKAIDPLGQAEYEWLFKQRLNPLEPLPLLEKPRLRRKAG